MNDSPASAEIKQARNFAEGLRDMSKQILSTDYLIVGSGAVGMAFADTLVHESDADIIIVDMHGQPGGHWNDAYPFVTLHQPSSFYGVGSMPLGHDRLDQFGLNEGLGELATGAEVNAYYEQVMHTKLIPSGRVRYFPKCRYTGNGEFESMLTGEKHHVSVARRTVDTTYLNTAVPSTHTPAFSITDGVRFIPLNGLPKVNTPPAGYVVVGAGKTGADACLWLLEHGVDADLIQWIVPRDAWLTNRAKIQPKDEFFFDTFNAQSAQFEAAAQATSIDDLYERLEACGMLVRLDPNVRPTMFHAAVISPKELAALRSIRNIIRLGRVTNIGLNEITLQHGSVPTTPEHLFVDCSASAILGPSMAAIKPIFQDKLVLPQTIRSYQPAFSAAVIAHIELAYDNDTIKNELCQVVPLPNHAKDWVPMTLVNMMNLKRWSEEPALMSWQSTNRLNGFSALSASAQNDPARMAVMKKLRANLMPAAINLMKLMETSAADG
ncbi:MAG: hypothetical protein ACJAWK_001184 [Candidatus Azotimanducaceae bacterium]